MKMLINPSPCEQHHSVLSDRSLRINAMQCSTTSPSHLASTMRSKQKVSSVSTHFPEHINLAASPTSHRTNPEIL